MELRGFIWHQGRVKFMSMQLREDDIEISVSCRKEQSCPPRLLERARKLLIEAAQATRQRK